jgi:beta-galactosidase
VPENVWEYRLSELRKIGCNAIRTSHNPPAPEFLDLCDRMGFLVMDEFCDKWEPPHYLAFETRWRNDIASWVRRDRTHPSVILWSVGNENDRPGTPYLDHYLSMRCAAVRVIGLFYWTGIDYLGEAYRSWPHIAMTGRDRYPSF